MTRYYQLKAFSKTGDCVWENKCQASSMEYAIELFVEHLESCVKYTEKSKVVFATLDQLQYEYTIKHRRIYDDWDEFHPCYRDYTIIQVQLDIDI